MAIPAIAALWWAKPWADSVMTASVILSTDEDGSVRTYRAERAFSSRRTHRPVVTTEIDLRPWAGRLLMLEVQGNIAARAAEGGSMGNLACAAELISSDGAVPVQFAGWQQGAEIGLHVGPIGPRTFVLESEGNQQFAYTVEGHLRHVLSVPGDARLRLSVRPVLPDDVPGRPVPAVCSVTQLHKAWRAVEAHAPERPPDVFIYLIDALRADHLGCYGYERGTSPNIDAFALGATLYEQAQTASTWTRPSVASMLTGLYPMVHRAMHQSDVLDDWPVLLPEMLHEAGYTTQCIVANVNVDSRFGFDQGSDTYIWQKDADAGWVSRKAAQILADQAPEQPVFMYLHTMEPHEPYAPGADALRRFDRGFKGRHDGSSEAFVEVGCVRPQLSEEDIAHLIDLYDGEVFEADQGFGTFLNTLRNAGRFDDALIILVADHGEGFAEHNTLCHGRNLNQEEMRVPLIVRYPHGGRAGTRVGARVSLLDIVPTVLTEVGLKPELDYRLPGRSLQSVEQDVEGPLDRVFFAEVSQQDSNAHDLLGVIDSRGYKRVVDVSVLPRETAPEESLGLWDTESDPAEIHDLSGDKPVLAAYLDQLIVRWLYEQRAWRDSLGVAPPPRVELTDELEDSLRTLGYLR